MYVRTLIFIRYKTISLNLRLNLAFFSSSEGRLYEEAAGLSIIGYDASELKAGIEWLFSDEERYNRLSHAARRQILNENSFAKVLEIHSELKPYL